MNPERRKEQEHRDLLAEKARIRRESKKGKEAAALAQRKWKENHREYVNIVKADFYHRNKEEINQKRREYYALHKEEIKEQNRLSAARRRAAKVKMYNKLKYGIISEK